MDINKLLEENKKWAQDQVKVDPDFFKSLASLHSPEFFWIGCSDSRVPANEITNTKPGEIFVHRNVANVVDHNDINMLSALQYAVEVLKVKHVIVCGHYGCGGILASMKGKSYGLLDKWLSNIKDVYRLHRTEIDKLPVGEARANCLAEFHVREQVNNLLRTNIVQKAWKEENRPTLHGWVYGLKDGVIKHLTTIEPNSYIDPLYKFTSF